MLSMSAIDRQGQMELYLGKAFVNTRGVFGYEVHFMSFAAIVASRNGTEGSNYHICNTVIAIIKMSGNRLVSIIANNCTPSLVPVVLKQAREKNVDVVRDWDLGVTSSLKVLQNA